MQILTLRFYFKGKASWDRIRNEGLSKGIIIEDSLREKAHMESKSKTVGLHEKNAGGYNV